MRENSEGERGWGRKRERREGREDWVERHLAGALTGKNGRAVGHRERAREGRRDLSLSSDWPGWPIKSILIFFNFFSYVEMPRLPLIKQGKIPFCPAIFTAFHILPSLKKFRPQNLECNTSTKSTGRLPSLKSPDTLHFQLFLTSIKLSHVPEYLTNHNLKYQVY